MYTLPTIAGQTSHSTLVLRPTRVHDHRRPFLDRIVTCLIGHTPNRRRPYATYPICFTAVFSFDAPSFVPL